MGSDFSLNIMKKTNFLKGMAALTIVAATVGCSKNNDLYDPEAKVQESASNFVNNVLGGRSVDPSQTWSTSTPVNLTVSSEVAEGVLKVYASTPVGQYVAPIYTGTITKGEQKTFTVNSPSDVSRLYVAVYDSENYMRYQPVNVTGSNLSVKFESSNAQTAPSRARKAPGTTFENQHEFLPAPDAAIYAENVPDGVTYIGDLKDPWGGYQLYHFNIPDNTCWVDQAAINNCGMNFNRYNGYTVYVKGVVNSTDLYLTYQSKIYLTKGSKLILPKNWNNTGYSFGQQDVQIIVAEGAELVCEGTLQFSNTILYNKGTVTVNNLQFAGSGKVYNQGKLKVNNTLTIANNNCEVVNEGELEANELQVNGSGHFMNLNLVKITGDAVVNSNNNSWINNGTFHCNNFLYNGGGSWNVINNCKLFCKNQFYIGIGQGQGEFKLDGSIDCKTFFHGIGITRMAAKSIIKVAETLTCQAQADGCYYGFYGPTTNENGYAVVQANKITATSLTQRRSISYRNYLIVATNDHWEQCSDQADGNYPYWDQGDNVKMSLKNKNDITETITPSDCNTGISGGTIVINEPTEYYYYAFEDLGTIDDFDFNDVILRVSAPVNGQSTVELVAAGGTLETYITYGTGDNPTQLAGEVHATLGANATNVMLNTTSVDTTKFANIGTINVAGLDMGNLPFGIKVKGNNGQVTKVVKSVEGNGKAPLVIVVSGNEQGKWFWPTERTNITVAYEKFGDWGVNATNNKDWFRTPTGAVVNY